MFFVLLRGEMMLSWKWLDNEPSSSFTNNFKLKLVKLDYSSIGPSLSSIQLESKTTSKKPHSFKWKFK